MHLFDNGPPGIPVSEVVLVLVSPLTKAVSMDPTSMEHNFTNFPSIEFNSIDFKSIQLVSMGFSSNRNEIHGILFHVTLTLGNLIHIVLFFSMIFPTTVFFLKDSQSVEKSFLVLTEFKRNFR